MPDDLIAWIKAELAVEFDRRLISAYGMCPICGEDDTAHPRGFDSCAVNNAGKPGPRGIKGILGGTDE